MIIKGERNDEDGLIDKYLVMNMILDVGTNKEHRVTVFKRSWRIGGTSISRLRTNTFFYTC